ncbi:MAG: signal transduction histidine kinase, partial [Microbacterium sp.]|nr:signal transduction histidine kinase [Microbacterium sp.]
MTTPPPPEPVRWWRRGRPWSLQARLMTAVIGMVAFILIMIGVST